MFIVIQEHLADTSVTQTQELTPTELASMQATATGAAALLRSISHPMRLMILCNLAGTSKSVSELCAAVNLPQAQMSQQLARLRQDMLVKTKKSGTKRLYSITDPKTEKLVLLLHDLYCAQN